MQTACKTGTVYETKRTESFYVTPGTYEVKVICMDGESPLYLGCTPVEQIKEVTVNGIRITVVFRIQFTLEELQLKNPDQMSIKIRLEKKS